MKSITNYIKENYGVYDDDHSDEFDKFKREFEDYWIPSIKKFYKVIKSTNILTANVWFTDCDTDYYQFAEIEFNDISKDVKNTFVSVDVWFGDQKVYTDELTDTVSRLLEDEPYDKTKDYAFWRFEEVRSPQDLVDLAYEIEAIDRQLRK